jgi:glucose-1-phosphatase
MRTHDPELKNLIFDLGGVIINLAPQRTIEAFARLAHLPFEKVEAAYHAHPEFNAFEKGELTDAQFRSALREIFSIRATDVELDECWNAMLLDIPVERIQLLQKLRNHYRLFLLSNTNNIHLTCFNGTVSKVTSSASLGPFFDEVYYSHQMKMRKPDVEIYEYVLKENNLHPGETLFLDDNLSNLKGAEKAGIKTFHVQHPDLIFSLFHESKN